MRQRTKSDRKVLCAILDDVGWDLYDEGPTPRMDALAQAGRTYRRFWAGPTCSNFRARMQSGLGSFRKDNLIGTILGPETDFGLAHEHGNLLAQKLPGSKTLRGKWHLAPPDAFRHPIECGYDDWSGSLRNLSVKGRGYFEWEKSGPEGAELCTRFATLDTTEDALVDIEAGVDFVLASYNAVHKPFDVPPDGTHTQTDLGTNWHRAIAMLEALDREIGRLARAALEAGYLVIVASDNGTSDVIGGHKGTLREPGIRCPLFATGEGVVAGETSVLVGATDLYATIMELRGGDATAVDSKSFAGEMLGSESFEPRAFVACDRFSPNGALPTPKAWRRAVRDERYKLVALPKRERLADLQEDPDELTNLLKGELTGEQRAAYERLSAALPRLDER